MARVYAELVKKQVKRFCEVPANLREQVKAILISWGKEELVEDCE